MKAGPLQTTFIIQHAPPDIFQACRIHKYPEFVMFNDGIVGFRLGVKSHPVGESRTSTLLYEQSETSDIRIGAFFLEQR